MDRNRNESEEQCGEAGAVLPQHADNFLPGFVDLQIRSPANCIESVFPLDLRLEVDEFQVEIPRPQTVMQKIAGPFTASASTRLRMRLRYCYVRYSGDGLAVRADSKFRSPIELGIYSEKTATSQQLETSNASASSASLKATLSPALTAEARGEFSSSGAFLAKRKAEKILNVSQDLYEIEAVPGGWRVGDKALGDPLKKDSCLDGQYFGRPSLSYPHTCEVEFLPHQFRGILKVTVTCRDGLQVQTISSEAASEVASKSAISLMRDKLAAIRIEKELSVESDKSGEFALLETSVLCFTAREL